jgi:hypothetical protein
VIGIAIETINFLKLHPLILDNMLTLLNNDKKEPHFYNLTL